MANNIKYNIAQKLSRYVEGCKVSPSSLRVVKNKKNDRIYYRLRVSDKAAYDTIKQNSGELKHDGILESIETDSEENIDFYVKQKNFVEQTIFNSINPTNYNEGLSKRVVIEYSSPNIAKPFHVGHLRSTIIGNFLANINEYKKQRVTKLNYLGDWGTQFGLLKTGIDLCKITPFQIRVSPMETLYKAYVEANKLASTDESISTKARQIFTEMEQGNKDIKKEWNLYRKLTMRELDDTYNRLGTNFSEYHWESMYNSDNIKPIMDRLEERGIVKSDGDGKKVAVVNGKNITVMKSDGSSLYLSRDIAAIEDRYSKYNFDEMLYVVDTSQSNHFTALFDIMGQMQSPIVDRCKHVKFGRINGMSTRKGTAVFLQDILNEAQIRMLEKQATTKVELDDDAVADTLGITSVIINDLKQRREKNYDFTWERALQNTGDSGIKLQYLHCRLCGIEANAGVLMPIDCHPELLAEPEAIQVLQELARFDDVLDESWRQMEACILVVYLFNLSNITNRAINVLRVKDQPTLIAEQRLLLFHSVRSVLKRSLEILGVRPLDKM